MKKIIFSVLLFALIAVTVSAQTHKQYDRIKNRIQDELKISDVKADSAASIVQRYLVDTKKIRVDTTLSDESKITALKNERRQQIARLKTFLSADQIQKLQTILKNERSKKQQNMNNADTTLNKYYF